MTTAPSIPDCPFCRANNALNQEILAETDAAFLIRAQTEVQSYLVIPTAHVESLHDLPDIWWQNFTAILAKIPGLAADYNVSVNIGRLAGQSVKHLHFWVIERPADTPASGKGFARLIDEVNKPAN